ncbi:MAG: NBR1-Ig-like domain-containing protein [Acidobacteriota bacterium]
MQISSNLMKTLITKTTFTILTLGMIFLLSQITNAQSCEMDAQMRPSDVVIPSQIVVNKTYRVRVTVVNNGSCNWDTSSGIRLSIKILRGPSGSSAQRDELTPIVDLKYKIKPGDRHEFEYEITGPYYLGNYTLEWKMVKQNKWFGDAVTKPITVVPPK